MRVFHVALRSEWEAARAAGVYDRSTRGLSLAEVGFVHCARADQWRGVWERFYVDADEALVLLTIDTAHLARLGVPVVEKPGAPGTPPTGQETFPHVYGAVPVAAVVEVAPIDARGRLRSFRAALVVDVALRLVLALGVMLLTGGLVSLADAAGGGWWVLLAVVLGLLGGAAGAVTAYRRIDRRTTG